MAVPTNIPGSQLSAISDGWIVDTDALRSIVRVLARQAARDHLRYFYAEEGNTSHDQTDE